MDIYIVHFSDYDNEYSLGYFTNKEDAEACAEYYNRTEPSSYFENAHEVETYVFDDTDYKALVKELNDKERAEKEAKKEAFKQKELAELARLKAKYED